MRVLFDATMVKRDQGGIRSYARGMARALAQVPADVEVIVCTGKTEPEWFGLPTVRVDLSDGGPVARMAWRARHLPRLLRKLDADLLFVPSHETLPGAPVPQVFVIHDIGPLVAPALYGGVRFLRYALTLRGALERASAAVCVSTATKLDVMRFVGHRNERLHVIGQGPQPARERTGDDRRPRGHEAYALYVGAALPHKNLPVLVDAFRRPTPSMPGKLVLAGPEYADEVQRLRAYIGDDHRIEHRGFVPLDDLDELYAGATCLVFPSMHEGFGIPLLEAMQHRVPIVASDIPALREVAADAAAWVDDPSSAAAWRQALGAVAASEARRAALIEAGRHRLEQYHWSDVAAEMIALWADVAARR